MGPSPERSIWFGSNVSYQPPLCGDSADRFALLSVRRSNPSDRVATSNGTGHDHLGVASAEIEHKSLARVDEAQGLVTKTGRKLGAPSMGLGRDLNHRLSNPQMGASWEVADAQVEVDVELVASETTVIFRAGDQGG